MEKEKKADFRYDTGPTKVPWAAVGENLNVDDITEIIRFLIPPDESKDEILYQEQLEKVKEEILKLREKGGYATKLSLGDKVKEAEEELKKFLKVKYTVLLTNATAGFEIAQKFAGLRAGDEVIAPAITFCSTINYPLQVGAKVVLADIDPHTLNIDPEDVARKVTKKTKVIIAVHIGGYPSEMDKIMEIANENNIIVLEDAAHALGGSYRGKMSGTIGHFGSFSLHEVKNITSGGEGGVLVTDQPEGEYFSQSRFVGFDIGNPIPYWLYDVVALKGRDGRYTVAGNHSFTEIQAVVLLSQLKRLPQIIETRRKRAEYLNKRFKDIEGLITPPLDTKEIKSTYHLYLLRVDPAKIKGGIQAFKKKLTEKGVTQIPHFAPLYRFSYMKQLGYDTEAMKKTCPKAEEVFLHQFTHLPLYPLTEEQVKTMADLVIEAAEELKI